MAYAVGPDGHRRLLGITLGPEESENSWSELLEQLLERGLVRPDVAPIQRPQPDARSVVEPQPTSLRLPLRHRQPLLPPDPLHPLVVHPPAKRRCLD